MKKLIIYPNTGNPRALSYDDRAHLAESIVETTEALADFWNQPYFMLTKTVITNDSTTISCAAGWMVFNGEPCAFDAQSLTIDNTKNQVWVIVQTERACDPKVFGDSVSRSPHIINKVALQNIATGSLPTYYLSYGQETYKDDLILQAMQNKQGQWQVVGAAGKPAYVNGAAPSSGYSLQYKLDPFGQIMIKGGCDIASTPGGANITIFTLPSSYRPAAPMIIGGQLRKLSDGTLYSCDLQILGGALVIVATTCPTSTAVHLEVYPITIGI